MPVRQCWLTTGIAENVESFHWKLWRYTTNSATSTSNSRVHGEVELSGTAKCVYGRASCTSDSMFRLTDVNCTDRFYG